MLNTENFEQLFSEISEDLAEAINGGNNHNCHIVFTDEEVDVITPQAKIEDTPVLLGRIG